MKTRNIFRSYIHIYSFSLSIFSVLVPLLLLDPDHLLSEPLDLLLHLHDVVPLVPVCSEHPLHHLPVNFMLNLYHTLSLLLLHYSR